MSPDEIIDETILEAVDAGVFDQRLNEIAGILIDEVLKKLKEKLESVGAKLRTNPENSDKLHEDRKRLRKLEYEIPNKIRSQTNEYVKKIAKRPAAPTQGT
jgi:response regulator of citrate/malate metabolism